MLLQTTTAATDAAPVAEQTDPRDRARRLLWHGALLFLLGLLTGFVIPLLENPRMGLSSHLEGVLNGLLLIALGFLWPKLELGARARTSLFALALYGTYANWASTLLAAAMGTGRSTPIAAPGRQGLLWQEAIVDFGLISLSVAMVVAMVIVLRGLRRVGR